MDMSRISSSPWGFRFMDLRKFSESMRRLGITKICTLFGDPAKLPLAIEASDKGIAQTKRIAEDCGVEILETAIGMDAYSEQIPLVAELGAKYVRICEVWEDSSSEFERVSAALRQAGELASRFTLTVIVENHGGLMRALA